MKKTDLEKLNGLKIRSRMKNAGAPDRYGRDANTANQAVKLNPLMAKLFGQRNGDPDSGGKA